MTDRLHITRRSVLAGTLAATLAPRLTLAQSPPDESAGVVEVPVDHQRPADGTFPLEYGLLEPFEPSRKTIFVVADGQQFYVRTGAFHWSAAPIFGDRFNVVGVYGRADAPEIQRRVGQGATTSWAEAHRLLKAEQWLDDLEAVRQHLVGSGRVSLYGRSGGGFLAHQFVARHGSAVEGIFTQAAVNPHIEARFGLRSDRFWSELGETDRVRLRAMLRSGFYPRQRLALLFQRQNFFVPRAELAHARSALIEDLASQNEAALAEREAAYQIDGVASLAESARGPAINVRLFEFYAPLAGSHGGEEPVLNPDLEVLAHFSRPLVTLLGQGTIPAPSFNLAALATSRARAFLVAGRWDHTCDYRSQIALAAAYPNSTLLLLDDDHVFHRLSETGRVAELVQGALDDDDSLASAIAGLGGLVWRER